MKIRITGKPIILDRMPTGGSRAFGPGVHDIDNAEVARRLQIRGAFEVTGDEADDAEAAAAGTEPAADELPADFPARKQLIANGIKTRSQLAAFTRAELVALEHIGDVLADRILEAREELD